MHKKILGIVVILLWAVACTSTTPFTPTAVFNPAFTLPTPTSLPTPVAIAFGSRFALRDLPGAGRNPVAMALLDGKVYVVNSTTDNVAVIQDNRVVKFIAVGKNPAAIAVDPAQKRIYISNAGDKTLSVIANDQVALTQGVGDTARTLLYFENRLFIGSETKPNILVLDPATLAVRSTILVPNAFSIISLAGDAAHHRVYANVFDKTAVIDSGTLQIVSTISVKGSYMTVAANPQANTVYLTNYEPETQSQFLIEFDASSGASRSRTKIPGDPRGAVVSADGSRVYVVNSYKSNVVVINTRDSSVIATIPVGRLPNPIALDENSRRLFVGNYESDSVTVINTDNQQIVATIPLGMIPAALVANPSNGRVYIANESSDSVFVIEGAHITKEIVVGRDPVDLTRDAASNQILIANQSDGTISILNEQDFSVRATSPITGYVTTVEFDAARSRVIVNEVILDAKSLAPSGRLTTQGFTLGLSLTPSFVRVNPNNNRIYAMASNGVPGSNSRMVTYSIDGDTLKQRAILPGIGSTLYFAVDPDTNRVYQVETHPLAQTHHLTAFDADDKRLVSLPLSERATGLLYNPQTHHLFISHATNPIQVFDVTTFGEVTRMPLNGAGKMARLGNTIYVASEDGVITLIEDAVMPAPPAPTATLTPTPFPSSTLAPVLPTTPAPRQPSATPRASVNCATQVASLFTQKAVGELMARLGCPNENAHSVIFALQVLEHGRMFYRDDEKRIYAITDDRAWVAFEDKWTNGMPEDSCSSIIVAAGRIKPKRGFGKIWCENADLRAKIGSGNFAEEGPYSIAVQRFEHGVMFGGPESGVAWALLDGGKWE